MKNWFMQFAQALIYFLCLLQGCGNRGESDLSTTPLTEAAQTEARRRMVSEQLVGQRGSIQDPKVLQAIRTVPRHEFVPLDLQSIAYADRPLPIGEGQTISQPYIVAYMTEQLQLQPTDRVLEIGTGSGYQAAILSLLVEHVYTIEIIEPLGRRAQSTLDRLNYRNVTIRIGDGYGGWEEQAPFDAIIVTCAPENIPKPLVEQLKEGGRLIIPVGRNQANQELLLLQKQNGEIQRRAVLPVRFVPMTGEAQSHSPN